MPASRLPRISTVIESYRCRTRSAGGSPSGAGREYRFGARQQCDRKRQSENSGDERQHETFAHDLRDDDPGPRSQGPADADLLRSFADDDQHDVADPYQSGQQRADPDDPGQRADSAEQRVELVDLFAEVLRVDRFRIVRRYGVSCEDQLFDIRFHLFDVGIVVCGDRHRV